MADEARGALVEGSVGTGLARMALPMAFGMVFMIAVNIIDTYWVSRLGTKYVAAMTYTFPVVGLIINLSLGVMIGVSTAVARAVGGGDEGGARTLTRHALLLAFFMVLVVSGLGLLSQGTVFGWLGAKGEVLELTEAYMTLWYLGSIFLVIPMIMNGVLRARGDAKTPMVVMMMGAIVNAVVDPLLIFGFGPIPPMGFKGAAIATVIARFCGMIYVGVIVIRRKDMVSMQSPLLAGFVASAKKILSVGAPAALTNALGPLAVALITGIVASYGPEALAAYGIGARVDALVLMAPMALGGALSPFVGQNWGAHLLLRVADSIRLSLRFVVVWGLVGWGALVLLGPLIGGLFTEEPAVLGQLETYFLVIPIGYAFLAVSSIASSAFNAVDRAARSTMLSLLRSLIIAVPAAYVGGHFFGLTGVFSGLVVASVVSALVGLRWLRTLMRPDGEISPETGEAIRFEDAPDLVSDAQLSASMSRTFAVLTELEGMDVRRLKGGVVGFFVGRRELGHLHASGRLDLPLPVEIGDNLVRRGVVQHHPGHQDNGWYSRRVGDVQQVPQTLWLLQLAHLLYEVSRRGVHDPITQEEMQAFTATEQCVRAMKASAKRWEPGSPLLAGPSA